MNTDRETTPAPLPASRTDLHCHSSASEISKLGVQRSLGLPECATSPEEVYSLAKRRGMDFVTITDHDTIDGVLQIADRPDVFISEELTASFRGEPQAVHILCFGISPEDHEWLQAHRGDLELCAAYMYERDILCALAHPYYTVAAPLSPRHRNRLASLFGIWEVRNGARAPELNRPAAMYVATRDGIGIAGSDDHAGIDIGRTYTETPAASSPCEFLEHIAAGRASGEGQQGSPAKWAHAAIAIAIRTLGGQAGEEIGPPDPRRVLSMASRVLREGDRRAGPDGGELSPEDARRLLQAWLSAVGFAERGGQELIEHMQGENFSHAELHRRACRVHEQRLGQAVGLAVDAVGGAVPVEAVGGAIFDACIAAIPYAPATAFLANEQSKLGALPVEGPRHRPGPGGRPAERTPRVAILADGINCMHGVTRTIEEIRQRGVPGHEVEIVGTDPQVDRRLPAVAEIDVPFYPGMRIGVPSLPGAMQALIDGSFDAIHVCSPGPAGIAGALVARALGLPLLGSYHTELTAYAGLRSGELRIAQAMAAVVGVFYSSCDIVLSPSAASDGALASIGIGGHRVLRWDRGVDTDRFDPDLRSVSPRDPSRIDVLYSGRITREKGVELLGDSFLAARSEDPRLHLTLAGGGPEQEGLAERLGEHATFLGWLDGGELARAYANADIFLFPSATDTFGQVILEAQASGLAVIAVAEGGPLSLIEDGVTGLLRPAAASALASAVVELAASPARRAELAGAAVRQARMRTWERTLELLAEGYAMALDGVPGRLGEEPAARAA
jgi:glycosyltransferase involved in cell wall biosynthesis/predicted metal-dependent phosphoesterase TrpH